MRLSQQILTCYIIVCCHNFAIHQLWSAMPLKNTITFSKQTTTYRYEPNSLTRSLSPIIQDFDHSWPRKMAMLQCKSITNYCCMHGKNYLAPEDDYDCSTCSSDSLSYSSCSLSASSVNDGRNPVIEGPPPAPGDLALSATHENLVGAMSIQRSLHDLEDIISLDEGFDNDYRDSKSIYWLFHNWQSTEEVF